MAKLDSLLVKCSDSAVSLQQIPLEIREAFEPSVGHSFLSIDYSQIEYKVFANLSGDPNLIAAIEKGTDFHTEVASEMLGVPYSEVTPSQRNKGKTINLALLYGMTDYGLSVELNISEAEASKLKKDYDAKFPIAAAWISKTKEEIKKTKVAKTHFGRERIFTEAVMTDRMVNQGFNTIIQGTAADIIKKAMIDTSKFLAESNSGKLVLNLHDELLFEIPDEHLTSHTEKLTNIMTNLDLGGKFNNLTISANSGKNWKEASK